MLKGFLGRAAVIAGMVTAIACSGGSSPTVAGLTTPSSESGLAVRGNGTPSGAKLVFSFNLIGTPGDYNGGCGDGRRIFVNRNVANAHILVQDDDHGWYIGDCNATGGHIAELFTDELGSYEVYVRILGKPGGTLFICGAKSFADADADLCELGTIDLTREGGKSQFSVKAKTLFDAENYDVFWAVDTNSDYRIAQFRVYKTS